MPAATTVLPGLAGEMFGIAIAHRDTGVGRARDVVHARLTLMERRSV
ncbi:MAG: hypothetical protein WDN30_14855 [Pararobbsia sp.]